MIDPIYSIAAYALQREQMTMSIMRQRMQAEAAMAQVLMDAAKNVERIPDSSSGPQGSIIDIYA